MLSSTFLLKSDLLLNLTLEERDEAITEMFSLVLGDNATTNFSTTVEHNELTVTVESISHTSFVQPLLPGGCFQEFNANLQAALGTPGKSALRSTSMTMLCNSMGFSRSSIGLKGMVLEKRARKLQVLATAFI